MPNVGQRPVEGDEVACEGVESVHLVETLLLGFESLRQREWCALFSGALGERLALHESVVVPVPQGAATRHTAILRRHSHPRGKKTHVSPIASISHMR